MKKKIGGPIEVSESEVRLLGQLREHPELLERVQSLMDIACNTKGPLKTADEVEDLLDPRSVKTVRAAKKQIPAMRRVNVFL